MHYEAKSKAAKYTKSHEKTGSTLRAAPKSKIRSSSSVDLRKGGPTPSLELRNAAAQGSKLPVGRCFLKNNDGRRGIAYTAVCTRRIVRLGCTTSDVVRKYACLAPWMYVQQVTRVRTSY